jgi:hypothetical protein
MNQNVTAEQQVVATKRTEIQCEATADAAPEYAGIPELHAKLWKAKSNTKVRTVRDLRIREAREGEKDENDGK